MPTALPTATAKEAKLNSSRPPTAQKGGVLMMKPNHQSPGFSFSTLLSPAALQIELPAVVVLVLIAGRVSPEFGKLLHQFSTLLFR